MSITKNGEACRRNIEARLCDDREGEDEAVKRDGETTAHICEKMLERSGNQ